MINNVRAGEPIRESMLNSLIDGVNAMDASVGHSPSGTDSYSHFMKRGARPNPLTRIVVARMVQDVIPCRWHEANNTDSREEGFPGNNTFVGNAVRQIWSQGSSAWVDDEGVYLDVMAVGDLPLREDDILHVMFDPVSCIWFPLWTPPSAMIEITNDVADAEGFLEGRIKSWDSDLNQWNDGVDVWVVDANRR